MANVDMTFKANLLPNSNLGYSLGSSDKKWKINGYDDPKLTDTNTTYIFTTGDSNGQIKVTPSNGSAQNISVKGLGSNAYTSTSYLPLSGGTLVGDVYHNSSTGSKKFYFTRNGTIDESTALWTDDSYLHIDVLNDETTANILFKLLATDTEGGGGSRALTSYIYFAGSDGKSTITADYITSTTFTGALNGNASSASVATKATLDESGNNIKATYGSSLAGSGTSIVLKNKNNGNISSFDLSNYCPIVSTYSIPAAKGVRITYPTYFPVLISALRSNSGGRLILLGGGYGAGGTVRNDFVELVSCATSHMTWVIPNSESISNSIEIMNHATAGNATVIVWTGGQCSFTQINALTSTRSTRKVWVLGDAVTGAVWNDYAEYREVNTLEPGRCVFENGDDTMSLSTMRLLKGCSITSDTWGFALGETEKALTPIAVAGRVLAYPYESIQEFQNHIGDAVCSGPNGTVSIMSNEETLKYPLSIIGTISAIPDYEEWGSNEIADRPPVKVNGRVWIRIR